MTTKRADRPKGTKRGTLPSDFALHWRAEIDQAQARADATGATFYTFERKGEGFVATTKRPMAREARVIGPRQVVGHV